MNSRTRWLPWGSPSSFDETARENARGAAAVAVALVAVVAIGATGRTLLGAPAPTTAAETVVTIGGHITTSDDWTANLSNSSAWRRGGYTGGRGVRRLSRDEEARERREEEEAARRERRLAEEAALRERREAEEAALGELRERARYGGTYRTVCVRLCDGYFFPISSATTPEFFARDEAACRSRCSSSARLYVYPANGEPEQMVSVQRQPYSALSTAFLFRTKYDAACTCKPHPWEQEALAKHRAFADAQRNRKSPAVAQSTRTQPQPAPVDRIATDSGRVERPEGAMLLGADQPPPRAKAARNAEAQPAQEAPRNQRGGTYGRRTDWQSRAFGGY